ncbi:hypothetical protein FDB72_10450 [Clostridium botulinum]|uniref:hypothetical protein n=1 Tax=Clostridium botulinum TaxID=1491 RepID=UPI000581BA68|nr:hypothetical protein [Clostridium botulinum]NFM46549.1 hypothetical protein [Clostridium botulinum]BAQ14689.1 hypothetical protein CBB2_2579 [Clostridium botulinum]
MKLVDWLSEYGLESLKFNTGHMEAEFKPNCADKKAAWELYIELLTRTATQEIPKDCGDEEAALESIHKLFGITREIIKKYGYKCIEFTKISIVVLNQILRPFTTKWHKLSKNNVFNNPEQCKIFREDLDEIQSKLIMYTRMLASMSDVEDLTNIESIAISD